MTRKEKNQTLVRSFMTGSAEHPNPQSIAAPHQDPPAISLQGDVVNQQHFPMPGMGFPPNCQGHNPPRLINHLPPSQPPVDAKYRMVAKSTGSKPTAGKTPVVIPPRPVGFDIPVRIPGDNQDQSEHPKKRPSDKPAIVVAVGDFQKWNANFDKLKSVYEDGANIAKLPHNHVMSNWVSKQRKKYWAAVSKGLAMGNRSEPMYPNVITSCTYLPLTQDQVDALEALGMEWDPRRADFEVRLAAIKDYKERKGSLKGLYKEHKALYQWLFDQKERYLKKQSNAGLPEKDANCLRELGFNIPVQAPDGRHHRSEHPKNILAINVP